MHGSFPADDAVPANDEIGSSDLAQPSATYEQDGAAVAISDAHFLFHADFARKGSDLVLTAEDGRHVAVPDYFRHEHLPSLLSPNGAALIGEVVEALTGPRAPGQYAQAGAPASAGQVIGKVDKLSGSVTVVRNGAAVVLNVGDTLNKGDVLQTGRDSTLVVSFVDGTALSLAASTRMALNEFVYDASSASNNSGVLSLVQGGFAFIAGGVAHTGGLNLNTPVGTMGIRGTAGGASCADSGNCQFFASRNVDGSLSVYQVTPNAAAPGAPPITVQVGTLALISSNGQAAFTAASDLPLSITNLMTQLIQDYPQIIQNLIQPPQTPNPSPPPNKSGALGSSFTAAIDLPHDVLTSPIGASVSPSSVSPSSVIGNATTPVTVTITLVAPQQIQNAPTVTIASIAGDNIVNKAEAEAGFAVSGTETGADGQNVTVQIVNSSGVAIFTSTAVAADGAWSASVTQALAQALANGTYTVTANVADAAGHAAPSAAHFFTVAQSTIAIGAVSGDNIVNRSEATAGFAIAGTETGADGQTVTVQIVNSAGVTVSTLTTSAGAGIWSVNVTPAQALALANGIYTVKADVSDSSGNPAVQATHGIVVAETAITVGTISGDDIVNKTEAAAGFTIGGTETGADGQTVTVQIVNSAGVVVDTLTTAAGAGTWSVSVTSAQALALANGSYTAKANVSDAAGNPAPAATHSFIVAQTTITIGTIAGDDIVNRTEAATGFAIGGTETGADGQTVTVQIVNSAGVTVDTLTTTASAGTWSVSVTPAQALGLANGSYTATANVFDAAGNPAPQATHSFTVAQTSISIGIISGDDIVNRAEAAVGFAIGGTETGADGQTVTVQIVNSAGVVIDTYTTTAGAGTWSVNVTSAQALALANGNYVAKANVSDVAGNPVPQASHGFTVAQTTITIGVIAGDDVVNKAEATAGFAIGGTETGADGQTVTVQIVNGSGIAVDTYTTTAGAGTWSVNVTSAQALALANGSYTARANVSDAAGNPAPQADHSFTVAQTTITIGVIAGDDVINKAEATAGFAIGGTETGADGQTVTVQIVNGSGVAVDTYTTTAGAGTWSVNVTSAQALALANGSYTARANVSDAAGNPAPQADHSFTVAQTSITIGVIAGDDVVNKAEATAGFAIGGTETGADGQTVTVQIVNGSGVAVDTYTTTAGAGTWSVNVTSAQALALANGSYTARANVSDAAGNPARQADHSFTVAQTTITIGVIAGDDVVNKAEATAGFAISGTENGSDGQTVTVQIVNGSGVTVDTYTTTAGAGTWSVNVTPALALALTSAIYTVKADVSDASGSPAPQATRPLTVDQIPPTVAIGAIAGDDVVNKVEAEATAGFAIGGTETGADGRTVTVQIVDGSGATVGTYTTTAGAGTWSVNVPSSQALALANGNYTVKADVSDLGGNPATQATHALTVDEIAPTVTINAVTGDNIVSRTEAVAGFAISGTETDADGRTVTVQIVDSSGATVETYTTTALDGNWSVSVTSAQALALSNGNYTVKAEVSDAAGNLGKASQAIVIAETAITIGVIAGDDIVNKAEATTGFAIGGTESGADGQTVAVTIVNGSGVTVETLTTTAGAGTWSVNVTSATALGLSNGSFTVKANVSDAAGHAVPQGSRAIAVDETPPTLTENLIDSDDVVNKAEATAGFVLSGTENGADGRIVTVQIVDGSGVTVGTYTTTAGVGTWSVNVASAQALALTDGHYTAKVDVSDAAGNPAVQHTHVFGVDETPPTLTINTVAGDNKVNGTEAAAGFAISGTESGADGRAVTVKIVDSTGATVDTYTTTAGTGTWSINVTSAQALALANGSYTVKADTFDAAGNPAVQATHAISVESVNASNDSFTTTEQAVDQAQSSSKITLGNLLSNDSGIGLSVTSISGVAVDEHVLGFIVKNIHSETKGTGEVARYEIETTSGDAHLAVKTDGTVQLWSDSGDDPFRALSVGQIAAINFSYTASNGHITDTATASIQVNGSNDSPHASNDSFTTTEQLVGQAQSTSTLTVGNLLHDDSDPDVDDTLSVASISSVSVDEHVFGFIVESVHSETRGTGEVARYEIETTTGDAHLAVKTDGTVVLWSDTGEDPFRALSVGQSADIDFNYTISDGHGGTDSASASITVNGSNDAPQAVADSYTTTELAIAQAQSASKVTVGNVLSNDGNTDVGDTLTVTSINTVTVDSNVSSFSVQSITSETKGAGEAARYQIHTASGDAHLAVETDGSVKLWSDSGDNPFQALSVAQNATIHFNYSISDGHGGASSSQVSITVGGSDDGPRALNDSYVTTELDIDQAGSSSKLTVGNLLSNDGGSTLSVSSISGVSVDEDVFGFVVQSVHSETRSSGEVARYEIETTSGDAHLAVKTDGTVMLWSDSDDDPFRALSVGQSAAINFNYTVTDGHTTDTATALVTVSGSNDTPNASSDSYTTTELAIAQSQSSSKLTLGNVLNDDSDPDVGDTLTVTSISSVSVSESVSGFSVSSISSETKGAGEAARYQIHTATGDAHLAVETDGSVLLWSDSGENPFQGLNVGQNATIHFNYSINDGHGGADSAAVSIQVNGSTDGPRALNDSFTTTEQAIEQAQSSSRLTVGSLLSNDSGSSLSVTSISGVAVDENVLGFIVESVHSETKGTGEVARYEIETATGDAHLAVKTDGSVMLWSDSGEDPFRALGVGQSAAINFNYTVSDGHTADTATASVTVNGSNDTSHASNDSFTTSEQSIALAGLGSMLTLGNMLSDDSDPDVNDHLTVSSISGVSVTPSSFAVQSITSETADAGEAARYQITTSSGDAHLAIRTDGSVMLWSDNGENPFQGLGTGQSATINFNYTASDGHSGTSTAAAAVHVNGSNSVTFVAGAGVDNFVFAPNFGQVTIQNFTSGTDQIELNPEVFANMAALLSATHDEGGSAVVTVGANEVITIQNVTKDHLQAHDFHLT